MDGIEPILIGTNILNVNKNAYLGACRNFGRLKKILNAEITVIFTTFYRLISGFKKKTFPETAICTPYVEKGGNWTPNCVLRKMEYMSYSSWEIRKIYIRLCPVL